MNSSLSVILPFHNEEENVEPVVSETGSILAAASIPYQLVCVDSGSTDATGATIDRLAAADERILKVPVTEPGYGLAVIRGLNAATSDWVSVSSGDGQVDPADIVKGYRAMESSGADLIKPRRTRRDDGLYRVVVSFFCSLIMKCMFQLYGWDFMAPPKVLRRSHLKRLKLYSKDRFIDTELLIKSRILGFRIQEVGVVYRARERGEGKVKFDTIIEYLGNILRWRLQLGRMVQETPELSTANCKD